MALQYRQNIIHTVILTFLLAFMAILQYHVHADYPYPFHTDEWHHIAKAVQTQQEATITFTDPYFKMPVPKITHEEGFHALLSVLFTLTGLDIVGYYRFLPALSAAVTGLALYVLMRRITTPATALTSLLFLSTIKSNVNILGLWFYTPFSASFPLIYITSLAVIVALDRDDRSWMTAAVVMALALGVLHPLSALFLAAITLLYLLVIPGETSTFLRDTLRQKTTLLLIACACVLLALALTAHTPSMTRLWSIFTERIVFPKNLIPFDVTYSIVKLYGLGASAASFLGVVLVLRNPRLRYLVVWVAVSYAVIFMYHKTDYTLLLPYHRALYYGMLGMAPLSAIGVIAFVEALHKRLAAPAFAVPLITVLVLAPILTEPFKDYYHPPSDVKLYRAITKSDYEALVWLGREHPGGQVVLAPFWESLAVYPLTGNHVIATVAAVLGGGGKDNIDQFFSGDCDTKAGILSKYRVSFVLSKKEIACPFLTEAYRNKQDYIYKVA